MLRKTSSSVSVTDSTHIVSQLRSILAGNLPDWDQSPEFISIFRSISPVHVSDLFSGAGTGIHPRTALRFFDLLPLRRRDVRSHASLLRNFLVPAGFFPAAERICFTMAMSCVSPEDAHFVMALFPELGFQPSLRCYNLLLASLSRFLMINELRRLFSEMSVKADGVSPDLYAFNSVIEAYCRLGDVAQAEAFLGKMLRSGFEPDNFTRKSLIWGYSKNGCVETARKVFDEMPERTEPAYANMIHGFCRAGRDDEALELLAQMRTSGFSPSVKTHTILLQSLCRLGRVTEAIELFRKMKEKDAQSYNVLVGSLAKDGKFDEASDLVKEMSRNRVVPSVVTYNVLIDGYCKRGMVDSALGVFRLMESEKCPPDSVTFTSLIGGHCRRNQVHRGMSLLSEMLKRKLSPNKITFTSLIHGQLKAGHIDIAYKLLGMMNDSGLVSDEVTYGVFIDGLCKNGRLDEADSIFESLREKGISANETMCNALISGYCGAGRIAEALEMISGEDFLASDCAYNALIGALCKDEKRVEIELLLEAMLRKGVNPTVVTYTILAGELLESGEFENARRIADQMISSGTKPDSRFHNKFLEAHCNLGNTEEAESLLEKMIEDGVSPDSYSYTFLIDMYGNLGSIDRAFDALNRMIAAGCEPSSETYRCLIQPLIKKNKKKKSDEEDYLKPVVEVWKDMEFEDATRLFEEMGRCGCGPHAGVYEKLIAGLCGENRLDISLRLLDHMGENGISPTENIYCAIFSCCCESSKMYGETTKMLDVMIEKQYFPSLDRAKTLVCKLCEEGKEEEAKSVFCKLLRCGFNCDEVAWEMLIHGLLKKGFAELCKELASTMEKMECHLHSHTHSLLKQGIDKSNK